MSTSASSRLARLLAVLLVVLGLATLLAMALTGSPGHLFLINYSTIKSFIAARHDLALVTFLAAYVISVALCLPTNVIMALTAGALFGGLTGGFLSIAAATLGGTLSVIALRAGFAEPVARRASQRLTLVLHGLRRNAFTFMLFLRLVPIVPFFMVNVAAGISAIRLPIFVIATLIGIAPIVFLYTFTAARLEHMIAEQAALYRSCSMAGEVTCPAFSVSDAITFNDLAPLFALAFITLLPIIIRHWLGWRTKRQGAHG